MLNKSARKMLYGVAAGIKREHPEYSNHTCLEEAMFLCGRSVYTAPLDTLLPEYRKNPGGNISEYIPQPKTDNNDRQD